MYVPNPAGNAVPAEYYEIVYTYSCSGNIYYEAELLKEYKGVYRTCGLQTFFFMDVNKKPVSDLETIKKLWTIHMFVRVQDDFISLSNTLSRTTNYYIPVIERFLKADMLMETLGGLAEGALKAALTGGASLWGDVLDILDKTATSDNVFMVTEIMLARHLANGASTAAAAFQYADVTGGTGIWDYELVTEAIGLFKNVYMLNQSVEGICMPIVNDVLNNYSSDFEYAIGNLGKMATAFFKAAIEDLALAEIDFFFRNWKSISSAKELLTGTIQMLSSDIPTGTQGWYNLAQLYKNLSENIEKLTGIDDSEVNKFLAPLYFELGDIECIELYNAQLKLAD